MVTFVSRVPVCKSFVLSNYPKNLFFIFLVKMVNRINTKNVSKDAAQTGSCRISKRFLAERFIFLHLLRLKKRRKRKKKIKRKIFFFLLIGCKNACLWSSSGSPTCAHFSLSLSSKSVIIAQETTNTILLAFLRNMTTTGSYQVIFLFSFFLIIIL